MNNIDNTKKIKYLLILCSIILLTSVFFPTLARYKNRTSFYEVNEWDGTITPYTIGSGTQEDPYIISNGSEFAYFMSQLNVTDYNGIYFELSNDIVLNKGKFNYETKLTYELRDKIYEIEEYSTSYGKKELNKIEMSDSDFKGHLNGNLYRIYGLYITNENAESLALFNSISGSISNLYISNSVIYGGYNTSMLAIDSNAANIENVMIDGYIIGKSKNYENIINITEVTNTLNLNNYEYKGNYINSYIEGIYTKEFETDTLNINGVNIEEGQFKLDLGQTELESIEIIKTNENSIIENLKYVVETDYGVSAGYFINADENTTLNQTVNKSFIKSNSESAGFIHTLNGKITITNSYNSGKIISKNTSSGFFITSKLGKHDIENCFQAGLLESLESVALISKIEKIDNPWDALSPINFINYTEDYIYNDILDGYSNPNNSYAITQNTLRRDPDGRIWADYQARTIEELTSVSFLNTSLNMKSFVNIDDLETNEENIWVLKDGEIPILYIDDLNKPIANINASIYSWNTFTNKVDTHKFAKQFKFNIEVSDVLTPVSKIEYYISKSENALLLTEVEAITQWTTYSDIVTISEVGSYIIYAKLTDTNNNETYINSDILIIDTTEPVAKLKLGEYNWSTLSRTPEYIYLTKEEELTLEYNENIVRSNDIYYYISENSIEETDIYNLEEWNNYTEPILINTEETKIIYFKIYDKNEEVSYISTDYIKLNGFKQTSQVAGRNLANGDNLTITPTSRINMMYSFKDTTLFKEGYKHNLISNTLLPEGTQILIQDTKSNKTYKYITTSNNYNFDSTGYASYPFSMFNEIGTNETKNLNDSIYIGEIDEEFKITLDFKDSINLGSIKNISLCINITDTSDKVVISSIKETLKTFNLEQDESELILTSTFEGKIDYNTNNSNNIDFKIDLTKASESNIIIYDTTTQDKKYGLEIKLFDNENEITLPKEYLSHVQFKFNEVVYKPNSEGIINIDLNDIKEGNLIIDTYINKENYQGDYSFNICPYNSYDGVNYQTINNNNCLNIPLNLVENYKEEDYLFDVNLNNEDRILSKNTDKTINFDIMYQSKINNPSIRVSLYQKDELTAYNQNYSLVNLQEYIYDELELIANNTYYLDNNIESLKEYKSYSLSFKNTSLKMTGYKLVFELYDDNRKIGSIEKKFIVKGGD